MSRRIAAIIRHGEYHQMPGVPSAHQPFSLNTEGESHACRAATIIDETLHKQNWSLQPEIDSSQMLRAWQTARIIADKLGERSAEELSLKCFGELAERSVGCAANLTTERIRKIIQDDPRYPDPPADWKSNSRYCLPLQGAESLLEAGGGLRIQDERELYEAMDLLLRDEDMCNKMGSLAKEFLNKNKGALKRIISHTATFMDDTGGIN